LSGNVTNLKIKTTVPNGNAVWTDKSLLSRKISSPEKNFSSLSKNTVRSQNKKQIHLPIEEKIKSEAILDATNDSEMLMFSQKETSTSKQTKNKEISIELETTSFIEKYNKHTKKITERFSRETSSFVIKIKKLNQTRPDSDSRSRYKCKKRMSGRVCRPLRHYTFPCNPCYWGGLNSGKPDGYGIYAITKRRSRVRAINRTGKKSNQWDVWGPNYKLLFKYVGNWRNGNRYGEGSYIGSNGEVYVGQWISDKRNGKGTQAYSDKSIYIGQWKNNKKHGQGIYIQKGNKYIGDWKNGIKNGKGIETFSNGEKFVGKWWNGTRHGKGVEILGKNVKHVNKWTNSNSNLVGTLLFPDGRKYTGEIQNGKRHGKGEQIWKNGDKYSGNWIDDKRHGIGSMNWSNGKRFTGNWNRGLSGKSLEEIKAEAEIARKKRIAREKAEKIAAEIARKKRIAREKAEKIAAEKVRIAKARIRAKKIRIANLPTTKARNRITSAYNLYNGVLKCYKARQGYLLGYINEIEKKRADNKIRKLDAFYKKKYKNTFKNPINEVLKKIWAGLDHKVPEHMRITWIKEHNGLCKLNLMLLMNLTLPAPKSSATKPF